MTQVCIDKQRFFTRPGHKDGQASSNDALTIAKGSARYHQRMHRFVNSCKPNIRTQSAIGLEVSIVSLWIKNFFIGACSPDCSQNRPAQQLCQRLWGTDMRVSQPKKDGE